MSQIYEIVVFTASQREYANRVIDLIDPKRRIAHRLFREHCVAINKQYFLKNIQALGRKTADIILVDVTSCTI
jgi:CTD small phosphatase-like protein 2